MDDAGTTEKRLVSKSQSGRCEFLYEPMFAEWLGVDRFHSTEGTVNMSVQPVFETLTKGVHWPYQSFDANRTKKTCLYDTSR